MANLPLLTLLLVVPAAGALLIGALIPRDAQKPLKWAALLVALATFALSLLLWHGFKGSEAGMQFEENWPWFGWAGFTVQYHLGVDGISLFLVLLTTFLMVLALLGSWNIGERLKEYLVVMLLLEAGMLGVFLAADAFLFYVFWEATLLPMYLLIGVWGGPRRRYAAIKFILYTAVGSVLMLVAILALAVVQAGNGGASFDLPDLLRQPVAPAMQAWLFGAFALAFAIKVPLFPLHTWLPDAHVEAPTAGSVILAGVLLKMGTYGFLRFCLPLFPDASQRFVPIIAALALIGIVYGALVALVQPDIKKLVAYSSVSHLGFVMLGLMALNLQGFQGGMLQMINHGISTGALFLLVGMIYERRHTRMIKDYGGLWARMPVFSAFFLVITLSSIALPFTNGFVGEFLILLGAFNARAIWAVIAATGMILSAAYMLWMFQRVFFGPMNNPENEKLQDLNAREILILVPLVALVFWIGIFPKSFLDPMTPALQQALAQTTAITPVAQRPAAAPNQGVGGYNALAAGRLPAGHVPISGKGAAGRLPAGHVAIPGQGGAGSLPPNHPAIGGAAAPRRELPTDHPPTGAEGALSGASVPGEPGQGMPANHPDIRALRRPAAMPSDHPGAPGPAEHSGTQSPNHPVTESPAGGAR